jgi:inositol phosphorylceramide synthase catalytic subunit
MTTQRRTVSAVIVFSRGWLLPSAAMPRSVWAPAIGLAYITTIATLGGLHAGNVLLGALGLLDVYNERSRLFLRTFLPCIITGALYDSFRFFVKPLIDGHIHVTGPYVVDRAFFGVHGGTLNELFLRHHWVVADLVAGVAYLVYVPEYLALTMVLFFRSAYVRARTFARGFLVVNLMGFVTYLVYPAAPPWYVTAHGFGRAQVNIAPSPGGGARFDELLGTHVFSNVYSHSVEVFGALPSLHVAYPVLAALLVIRTPALRWARWPVIAYALIMCFSAVYLQHHYVIDILLAIVYAVATAAIVLRWERRRG